VKTKIEKKYIYQITDILAPIFKNLFLIN